MTQINLSAYDEQIIARRYELSGILSNMHGEHATRNQLISNVDFEQTLAKSEGEKEKTEKRTQKSTRPETIHTFPKNEKGMLLIPWGGRYGYLMGALRTALVDLYKDKLQDKTWEGYGLGTYIDHSFDIKPQWLEVGDKFDNPLEHPIVHMIMTAGIRKSMMPVYYDVVNKAEIKFTIEQTNTKISEKIFLPMLCYCQRLGLGPKGRGQLQITNCTKTKGD